MSQDVRLDTSLTEWRYSDKWGTCPINMSSDRGGHVCWTRSTYRLLIEKRPSLWRFCAMSTIGKAVCGAPDHRSPLAAVTSDFPLSSRPYRCDAPDHRFRKSLGYSLCRHWWVQHNADGRSAGLRRRGIVVPEHLWLISLHPPDARHVGRWRSASLTH